MPYSLDPDKLTEEGVPVIVAMALLVDVDPEILKQRTNWHSTNCTLCKVECVISEENLERQRAIRLCNSCVEVALALKAAAGNLTEVSILIPTTWSAEQVKRFLGLEE